jgi:hypothetical protein
MAMVEVIRRDDSKVSIELSRCTQKEVDGKIHLGVTTACQCPANLTDVCLPRS